MATTIRVNGNVGNAKILVRITNGGAKTVLWSDLSDFVTGGAYADEDGGAFHHHASPGLLDTELTQVNASLSHPVVITWGNTDECITLPGGSTRFDRLGIEHTGSAHTSDAMVITPDSGCDGTMILILSARGARNG
tara:strand:- start:1274 stop:1681 length:408 start_codon:yes stop_codon:yes gene_type:complete